MTESIEQLKKRIEELTEQLEWAKTDIAEGKRAAEALKVSSEQKTKSAITNSIPVQPSLTILKKHNFNSIARMIFDFCKQITGATAGYVALLSTDGQENEVLFLDAGGRRCTVDPKLPMPIRGLIAEAYKKSITVYDNDFHNSDWMNKIPQGHVRLDNVLFTPLTIEEKTVGVMGLANKEGGFSEYDVKIATTFGKLAAVVLKNSIALERLEESEERFRTYINNSPDGIFVVDKKGHFIDASPLAYELLGYTKDELLQKSFTDIIPPERLALNLKMFQKLIETGRINFDTEFVCKDNSVQHIDLKAVSLPGENYVAFCRDITKQKQAEEKRLKLEEQLRLSETQFRSITENTPDHIMLLDLDANIQYINHTAPDLKKEEVIGTSILKFMPPEFHKVAVDCFQVVIETGEPGMYNTDYKTKNGEIQYFETRVGALKKDNKVIALVVRSTDVSERRKNEEKYRMLFETMTQGVVYQDAKGNIISANPAAENILGLSLDQMQGRTSMDPRWRAIHEDGSDFPGETHPGVVSLKTGKKVKDVVMGVFNPKDKAWRWININAIPQFRPGEDRPYLNFATFEDITERWLAEEQLRHSQKMEAIGQLAGGIAHDFNNILSGIIGFAELLGFDAKPGSEAETNINNILLTANRAAKLTTQLLGFARKGKFLNQPVDLHNSIKDVITFLDRTVDKNIKINSKLRADKHFIKGDPSQLNQVFLNLAINARDAMPKGGELDISTEEIYLAPPNNPLKGSLVTDRLYIKISITDNGCGIADTVKDHIFEPYFTTKDSGVGLGLAMTYGIIKSHNGSIRFYSKEGQGTTFELLLPLIKTPSQQKTTQHKNQRVQGSGTILVIDDDEIVCNLLSKLLAKLGYKTSVFLSGQEGIEYYRQHKNEIDFVLLDIIMPQMDGLHCFEALQEVNPKVKVLLITGFSFNEKAQTIVDKGALGFIQKPFKSTEIVDKINELIASK